MKPLVIIFCSVLIISAAAGGCRYNPASSPIGSGDGALNGYVYLHDTNGNVMASSAGAKVSVESGSQYTTTDSDGQFTLSGLPDAKFNLIFSKDGFAESRDFTYDYTNFYKQSFIPVYGARKIFQIRKLTPNLVIRAFEGSGDTIDIYKKAMFTSRIIDSLKQYSGLIKLYFGTDASISSGKPNSFLYSTTLATVDAQDGTANIAVYRDSLLNHGFISNTKIYVAAYMTGFYTQNQFYIDQVSGKRIYTGLSPFSSEVRNFVLP